MKSFWPWLLAALSGVLLALCYPPFDQGWLCWIALTPLTAALWLSSSAGRWQPLRLAGLGYTMGLVFFWMSLHWITEVTTLGWFVFAFYLALFPAAWALFVGIVARPTAGPAPFLHSSTNLRLAVIGAVGWTGIEWVRGTLFTGFGWNSLGVALWQNTALLQIADFAGVGGVSFLIVMVNLTAVLTVRRLTLEVGHVRIRPHYDFTLTLALVALAFTYGVRHFYRPPVPSVPLKVAAIQANIPQDQKWDPVFERRIMEIYRQQSEAAIALEPDLLVWPEAATPQALLNNLDMQREATALLEKHGGPFLLGTVHFTTNQAFNSAVLLQPDGDVQLYNKIHLVPFGEYVPFRETFPLFAWAVGDQVPSDFDAGTETRVLDATPKPMRNPGHIPFLPASIALDFARHPVRIAPLICFEDTLGDLTRHFAARGAQLLVTLTNDGWFRESAGSRQHLANSVFRAAETKLPMVRVANTGVTCFIDHLGRITETLRSADGSTFIEGFLFGTVQVPLDPQKTFYTRHGDLFALVCFFGSLVALQVHLFTARREHQDSA